MQQPERLPTGKVIAYGVGGFGWSLSYNIVSVMLVYIYLPPNNVGMKNLVPQTVVLLVFNLIALVAASGRFFDAIIDPLVANISDRSKGRLGRRIPYMRAAVVPMVLFAILIFIPPHRHEHTGNLWWIACMQVAYYFFFALYAIPYNALVAELGHYPNGKMHLSTAQSTGFTLGMVVSTMVPGVADLLQDSFHIADRLTAMQYSIALINTLGGLAMLIPAFAIDEHRYVQPAQASESVLKSLGGALRNHNFRVFALADASFFFTVGLISTGLLYYVTVLLKFPEAYGTPLMACYVLATLAMYPAVNNLEKRNSKKKMVIMAFLALSLVFFSVFFLGKYPVWMIVQALFLMVFFGIFDAFPGILPTAIIAEIAQADAKITGQNKEGMFFGIRAFFQKIGQTLGIMSFAMLTLYGKDPGHDLGLRLSGVIGGLLCLFAAFVYTRYREEPRVS